MASAPFKRVAVGLGGVALTVSGAAVFASGPVFSFIGDGRTVRWVAYPILLMATGLGGYWVNGNGEI